jgi:hypothetical protein
MRLSRNRPGGWQDGVPTGATPRRGSTGMPTPEESASRSGLWRGLLTSGVGVAHFVEPQRFEKVNIALGFERHTRKHVYINGAIETAIGLSMMHPRTSRFTPILGIGYIGYLAANSIRSHLA